MTTIPATTWPVEVIDFCSNGCFTPTASGMPAILPGQVITPWVEEECGCCGGVWGLSGSASTSRCRGIHIEGQVWRDLLMAEQEPEPDDCVCGTYTFTYPEATS